MLKKPLFLTMCFLIGAAAVSAAEFLPLRGGADLWSGAHAGISGGSLCATVENDTTSRGCGQIAGLHLGYDTGRGNEVVGIEGEINLSNDLLSRKEFGTAAQISPLTSIRLRYGRIVAENTLAYVTAGPAWASASLGSETHRSLGWLAGAGVERKFDNNLSLRLELLGGNFQSSIYGDDGCCGAKGDFNKVAIARVGINWNFPVAGIHSDGD